MNFIIKAIKWAYGDSLKYITMMLVFALIVIFGQALIVYPWQVILTLLGLFVAYVVVVFVGALFNR